MGDGRLLFCFSLLFGFAFWRFSTKIAGNRNLWAAAALALALARSRFFFFFFREERKCAGTRPESLRTLPLIYRSAARLLSSRSLLRTTGGRIRSGGLGEQSGGAVRVTAASEQRTRVA